MYEELINRYSWEYFCTGTFAYNIQQNGVIEKAKEYFRNLSRRLQHPIPRYWVVEPHKNIDRYHIHFLLSGIKSINENIEQVLYYQWRKISGGGRFSSVEYDSSRDGAGYVSKYLTKGGAFYDVGDLDKLNNRYIQYSVLNLAEALKAIHKRE